MHEETVETNEFSIKTYSCFPKGIISLVRPITNNLVIFFPIALCLVCLSLASCYQLSCIYSITLRRDILQYLEKVL